VEQHAASPSLPGLEARRTAGRQLSTDYFSRRSTEMRRMRQLVVPALPELELTARRLALDERIRAILVATPLPFSDGGRVTKNLRPVSAMLQPCAAASVRISSRSTGAWWGLRADISRLIRASLSRGSSRASASSALSPSFSPCSRALGNGLFQPSRARRTQLLARALGRAETRAGCVAPSHLQRYRCFVGRHDNCQNR